MVVKTKKYFIHNKHLTRTSYPLVIQCTDSVFVRCWYAPDHLKNGAKLHPTFDRPIRLHDKLKGSHPIEDFTRWEDHHAYQKAFERLLQDLKVEG